LSTLRTIRGEPSARYPNHSTTEKRRATKVTVKELKLPRFDYYLDESDPDVVVLRRQDGSFVAAFSATGATRESILEAAQEDYRALLEEHARSGEQADEEQERDA
jgi:hypothetical protein